MLNVTCNSFSLLSSGITCSLFLFPYVAPSLFHICVIKISPENNAKINCSTLILCQNAFRISQSEKKTIAHLLVYYDIKNSASYRNKTFMQINSIFKYEQPNTRYLCTYLLVKAVCEHCLKRSNMGRLSGLTICISRLELSRLLKFLILYKINGIVISSHI